MSFNLQEAVLTLQDPEDGVLINDELDVPSLGERAVKDYLERVSLSAALRAGSSEALADTCEALTNQQVQLMLLSISRHRSRSRRPSTCSRASSSQSSRALQAI